MDITFDPAKRATTLQTRGLDMADATQIFKHPHLTYVDDRMDYGEERFITLGHLAGRMVFIAWTKRGETIRIISMRKANEREQANYRPRFG